MDFTERDKKFNEMSSAMQKLSEELEILNKRRKEIYDLKTKLIENWEKLTRIKNNIKKH